MSTPESELGPKSGPEPAHVPEYIIAAGAYRSGSTWLYNALRLALELAGHEVYGSFYDATYDPEHRAKLHVVKVHRFEEEVLEVARLSFTSIRDPRDIAASGVRRGLIEPTVEAVEDFVEEAVVRGFERWRPHAAVVLRYEELAAGAAQQYLRQILDALAPFDVRGVSPEQLEQRLEALRPGSQYDRETLLWPNHITDGRVHGYRDTLSPEVIARIEERFGAWMRANGYLG